MTKKKPLLKRTASRTRKPAAPVPAAQKTAAAFPMPTLAKGEDYAGILLDGKGALSHHVIALAGEIEATHAEALAFAKKQGGELPTRKEQALLFANAAPVFKQRWYWSSEQHAGNAEYAWMQYFGYGYQDYTHQSGKYLARAVRRVPIR